jgi:hypothetical protein
MGSIHKLDCACNFSQDSWVRADTAQQKQTLNYQIAYLRKLVRDMGTTKKKRAKKAKTLDAEAM